ncbi:MAG: hypothetical protein JSV74_00430 [Dehalococcoidia bacterium]|nr:MAG: hypothetical protein JSV74_00430 [Dehalococcoidia bacterium]
MSTGNTGNFSPTPQDETRALLEQGLIDEYLKDKGYDRDSLKKLPKDEARRIMIEASTFASGKLSEIETTARYKHNLKDVGSSS